MRRPRGGTVGRAPAMAAAPPPLCGVAPPPHPPAATTTWNCSSTRSRSSWKAGRKTMASDGLAQSSGVKKFVAVAGNIGVGKSTLVGLLSGRLGWEPFYEPVGENPYLADFYRDMRSWSFPSQVFFLTRRLRSHRQLCDHPTSAIQDRSVYEDAEVFAHNLFINAM